MEVIKVNGKQNIEVKDKIVIILDEKDADSLGQLLYGAENTDTVTDYLCTKLFEIMAPGTVKRE